MGLPADRLIADTVRTTEDHEVAAAAMAEAGRAEEKLSALIGRIGSCFSRKLETSLLPVP